MSADIHAELFEQSVRGFFIEHGLSAAIADEWTDAIVAMAAEHPPAAPEPTAGYPNPCGVVLGQQEGVGPGLFICCQNERPCPDHPPLADPRLLAEARALLDAWCTAAEDGEALGPLREQTLRWLG